MMSSMNSSPNTQAGRPPIVGCPRLIIQCIRCYTLYKDTASSIRNLMAGHGVEARSRLSWQVKIIAENNMYHTHFCYTNHCNLFSGVLPTCFGCYFQPSSTSNSSHSKLNGKSYIHCFIVTITSVRFKLQYNKIKWSNE
jgi:hypothetical protein